MRATLLLLGLVVAASLVAPATAAAQAGTRPDAALAEVRELVFRARYDEAIARAQAYLERDDLGAEQRNAGLEALATAHIANRNEEAAMEVLHRLYRRDPGHRLDDPDASPLVQSAFARVRERRNEPVEVTIDHEPPELQSRQSPLVEARVPRGRDAVHEMRIAYRTGDMSHYSRVVMNIDEGGVARARLPVVGNPQAEQHVDYFIEALAPSLTPLQRLGSAEDPLRLTVPPTRVQPSEAGEAGGSGDASPTGAATRGPTDDGGVANQWWLWTIVGVVVVGGAVAGGLLLSSDDPSSGTLGSVSLQ